MMIPMSELYTLIHVDLCLAFLGGAGGVLMGLWLARRLGTGNKSCRRWPPGQP